MMRFSKDTNFARSTPTNIASYSVSLLDGRKPSRMAYSILSPIGALSFKPTPAPVWREEVPISRIHQLALPWSASNWGSYVKKYAKLAPLMLSEVYTEYRIHLVQLLIRPSFMIGQACVWCSASRDWLV